MEKFQKFPTGKIVKAPDWDKSLSDIQSIEKEYGTLAKTFQALVGCIKAVDELFQNPNNIPKSEDIINIENEQRLHSRDDLNIPNGDLYMQQSRETYKPVMRVLYSTINLREKIEAAIGPLNAEKLYENLKIALRFYNRHPEDVTDMCQSGMSTLAPEQNCDFTWEYMGKVRKDGPKTSELIELLNQYQGILNNNPNENQDHIAIDDKELTIIIELAESSDKTFTQVEIAAATNIKRGTLKDKLLRLESLGLVHRPLGERKGYQSTDKGREIANRHK